MRAVGTGPREARSARILPLPSARAPAAAMPGAGPDARLAGIELWLLKLLACEALAAGAVLLALHSLVVAMAVGHVVASLPAGRRAMRRLLSSPAGRWLGLIAPEGPIQRGGAFVLRLGATLVFGVVAAPVEVADAALRIVALRRGGARSPGWWGRAATDRPRRRGRTAVTGGAASPR